MALAERAGQGSWQPPESLLSAVFPAVCGVARRALRTCCPHRPEGRPLQHPHALQEA